MKKIAIIFPGQGSQYVGMGRKWFDSHQIAKQCFEEANETLGLDLSKIIFEGSMEELTKTEITQPAILSVSIAAFRVLLEETGVVPSVLAGHSLGEITALCAAGSLSFNDAVRLVHLRGQYMQEAVPIGKGSMAAISGVTQAQVEEVCAAVSKQHGVVVPSNYNTPDQIVISGESQAVTEAGVQLTRLNAIVIPLKVSAPFHSPLMKPAAVQLSEHMSTLSFQPLKYPVLSNVTGGFYGSESEIATSLAEQLTSAVQWTMCMKRLEESAIEVVIEAGPQGVLTQFNGKCLPGLSAFAMDKTDLPIIVSGMNTKPITNIVTKCIAITVCTKNRNWNNEEYQKGVVEPYRKIQKIQDELDQSGNEPTLDQMKAALDMLKSVFETKQVPMDERVDRFRQVFEETAMGHLFPDFDITGSVVGG